MTDADPTNSQQDPRIYFAAERTLLAWIRTGLALMGFGFVVARFGLFLREVAVVQQVASSQHGWSLWFGTALVLLGVVVTIFAAFEYRRFIDRLDRNQPYARPRWSLGLWVAAVLVVIGCGMAVYLLWIGH